MPKAARIAPILSLLLLAGLSAPAMAANLTGNAVVLRTLDKVTAQTKDFTVPVGEDLKFGSLTIKVAHCEKRPPEEVPETYAFLQIKDARLDGKGEAAEEDDMIFSGWMFASNPAISPLDHGVYDVWVLRCNVPASGIRGLRQ